MGRNSKEYQIFCSVRPEGLALRTNYAFEITTIANASPDILNNDYMSLFKYNTN